MTLNLVQRLALVGSIHQELPGASFISGFLIAAIMQRMGLAVEVNSIYMGFDTFTREHPSTGDADQLAGYEQTIIAFLLSGDPDDLGSLVRTEVKA